MRPRSILVGSFVAIAVLGAALSPVTAADHFRITSEDSQQVPERSVEFRGSTYQVDSFIVARPGGEINASVSGPDEAYRLYVYNSDRQLVDSRTTIGNDTFTFGLDGYEPGSYLLAVSQGDEYEAIKPLVVTGYDVSVVAPGQTTTEESMSIRVDIERNGTNRTPAVVKAVVSSAEDELLVNATGTDGNYTADVEPGALDNGNYTVYGIVQGDTEVFGRDEVLGVSDRVSLAVQNATTTATDAPAGTTRTSEPTATLTPTATRADTTASSTAAVETETPAPETRAPETEAPEAGESAITPNTDSQTETTGASGPGFSVGLTVVALVLVVVLRGRRD